MDSVANRIRTALELNNMKQSELVSKTGINKSALSSYLSGKYIPKQNNIYLMAKALNVSEAWLMGKDVPMDKKSNQSTYYTNPETAEMAQAIFENKELRTLFDAARDASPEDLQALHTMAVALKRKERGGDDG